MSLRTAEQLYDALANDLIWRRKELTSIRFLVDRAAPLNQPAILRAAVAVLYAHWEGFVKNAATAYLELIAFQRLRYEELATPILATSVRGMLSKATASTRIKSHIEITEFFLTGQGTRAIVAYKTAISSEGNLSSNVLREISLTLGLDYSEFETKANLIDTVLLETRNRIAHGEYLEVDAASYNELTTEIVWLMDRFFAQVSNAAALKKYLRAAA